MRLNPYHFGTLESCGQIWLERGNYRKAAEYFRQALEINPEPVERGGNPPAAGEVSGK